MGSEGQKICVHFSEAAPLQRYIASYIVLLSMQTAILETAHARFNSVCVFMDLRMRSAEGSAL